MERCKRSRHALRTPVGPGADAVELTAPVSDRQDEAVDSIFQSTAIVIAIAAAAWDVTTRRIPNVLTFGAALLGFAVHAYIGGWSGLGASAAGWLLGIALYFPFFALGGMGAGDVKLVGALGAWLGPAGALWVALYSAIAGGVMAVAVAALSRTLLRSFASVGGLLMFWRVNGLRPAPDLMIASHGPRLAYAVPVLAGVMVTLWLR